MFEETGLHVRDLHLLREWRYRHPRGEEVLNFAYAADAPDGDVRLSAEHTAFDWLTIDDYVERYCGHAMVAAAPAYAEFFEGISKNCELLLAWRRARTGRS